MLKYADDMLATLSTMLKYADDMLATLSTMLKYANNRLTELSKHVSNTLILKCYNVYQHVKY